MKVELTRSDKINLLKSIKESRLNTADFWDLISKINIKYKSMNELIKNSKD